MSRALALLGVPPADRTVAEWHVSPAVDVLAYHFSWLWVLAPILLAPEMPRDWWTIWALTHVIGFTHRHFTLPHVYLDGQVFRQFPARFVLVPVVLLTGFAATPALVRWTIPAGFFGVPDLLAAAAAVALGVQVWWADRVGHRLAAGTIGAVAAAVVAMFALAWAIGGDGLAIAIAAVAGAASFVVARDAGGRVGPGVVLALLLGTVGASLAGGAGLFPVASARFRPAIGVFAAIVSVWNIWHVYMQKFGILRLYSAKSPLPVEQRVPPWVDRFFVLAWVPLYFVWIGAFSRPVLERHAKDVLVVAGPASDAMAAAFPYLVGPAAAIVAASVAVFAWHEGRSPSAPRISMAIGTTGVGAAFLYDPLKAFVAIGFGHAIEYMVFVWAFQRRRYAGVLPHDPLLGRLLRYPVAAYGAFLLVVVGTGFTLDYADELGWVERPFRIGGHRASHWLTWWSLWSSMAHFYFDGFLWKMRLPHVRSTV